jgi:hypothetical protein
VGGRVRVRARLEGAFLVGVRVGVRVGALVLARDAGALVVLAVPAPDRDGVRVEVEGSDDEARDVFEVPAVLDDRDVEVREVDGRDVVEDLEVDIREVDVRDVVGELELEPVRARDRLGAGARVAAVLDVRLRAGVARPVPVPDDDRAGRGAEPGARRGEPPRPRSSPARVAGTSGPAARRVGLLRRVVLTAPPLLPGRVVLR